MDPTGRPEPQRVLVIDDRRDSLVPVQKLLQLLGQSVATATDGPTGIEKAVEFLPHVVLCDIGLPKMNGYDVGRALRARAETAGVYLVALTGYGEDEDRALARAAGFDFHMTKPVGKDQLELLITNRPHFGS